jgi:hypothetical protein
MDNNKVNSWMISTAVLALVVGFQIGCDSPRQQVSAQTSSGVTASELDFITGKYNGIPDSFQFLIPGNSFSSEAIVIPPDRKFVVTSFHIESKIQYGGDIVRQRFAEVPVFLGKNYDETLLPSNVSPFPTESSAFSTPYYEAGIVPGSSCMGNYGVNPVRSTAVGTGTVSVAYSPFFTPRRDMCVVYRAGDQITLHRPDLDQFSAPSEFITLNGYWLNAE